MLIFYLNFQQNINACYRTDILLIAQNFWPINDDDDDDNDNMFIAAMDSTMRYVRYKSDSAID